VEILHQLGDLFLAAVPTVVIVFIFYLFMRWSFFGPLERVLAERHRRAEGARQEAEMSRAAVQEKLRSYNESLRKARAEIFAEQDTARRQVLEVRQATLNAVRTEAQQSLQEAKKAIAAEVEQARAELEQSSVGLANEIAEAIIAGHPSAPDSSRQGDAR
jgi:F0F1-type ATP synthase membrane subunit b/b'